MGRRSELTGGRTVARQEGCVQPRGSGRRPKDRPPTVVLAWKDSGGKMLVLSRKVDEKIVINDCITICIVQVRGDKVRVGIEAPKSVPVHRWEVYQSIQREKAQNEAALQQLAFMEKVSISGASPADRPAAASQDEEGTKPQAVDGNMDALELTDGTPEGN